MSFFDPLNLIDKVIGGDKFKPITQPKLTPKGEKLEKELFKSIKTTLFPENLASRFIGDAKRIEQARRRGSERRFAGAGFRGRENVVGGNVAKGFLGETSARLRGTRPGIRRAGEARRKFSLGRLGNLQNFINLQSGTPILRAQAGLIKGEQEQAAGAKKGAFIGSLAQLAAMSDIRAKENISEIDSSLEKIRKLTGYTYNYIGNSPQNRDGGVMAQDVERVLPNAVVEFDGVKFVKYDAVIGLLINAVNELCEKMGV